MKNYKKIVPLALALILGLSYYMLYTTRVEVINQYNYYLEEARKYASQGIAVDAIKNYEQAMAIDDNLELNLEIGKFFIQMEDVPSAQGWGEQLIEKYPEEKAAYEFLFEIYVNNSDYNRSFALYETVNKRGISSEKINSLINDIKYLYYCEGAYEEIGAFCNGYCAVKEEGKWGMLNERGSKVVSCKYDSVGLFVSEVAPVKDSNGDCYYIDAEGNKKIVVKDVENIVELSPMVGGVFSAYDGESWSYYTSDLKKLSEGYEEVSVMGNQVAAVKKNDRYFLINAENKKINNQQYEDVIRDDKNVVYRNGVLFVSMDGKYNMINQEGKQVSKDMYLNARLFNDDTYAAVEGEKGWYFIDNTGKQIFDNQYYQDARSFSNGYAAVKQNGRWGFIDLEGNVVIDYTFDEANDFNASGCAFVYFEDSWHLLKLYSMNYAR